VTLALAPAAGAETYTVTGTADTPGVCEGTTCASIRQALASAAANPGADAIVVADGTHELTNGPLQIASDVTVQGASARTTSVVGTTEIDGAAVTLARLTLRGGLRSQGGTVTLDRGRATGGAGIANRNGSMLIESSLIDHNPGAGLVNDGAAPGGSAQLTVRNATIAFNGAGVSSSGTAADRVLLEHSTIARNSGAGITVPDSGLFSVGASIVADTCSGAPPTSAGANVGCQFEVHGVDPALAADLSDQGGDTDVLAIGIDSPARNLAATTCLPADQRGTARPQGPRCDAGAFELRYPLAIDSGPSGPTNQPTPTFTFSSSEGLTDLQCRIDGAPVPCADSYTPPAPLPDGAYTFRVENAGNSATRSFSVDTLAPVAAITQDPGATTNATTLSYAFEANEPSTFECAFAGSEPAPCTSPHSVADPPEGTHVFEVRAIDAAGNRGQPASRTVNVDRTDPVVRIDSRPTDPTNDSDPEFRFSANEPATFTCTLVGPGHTADPATECDNGAAVYRDLESGRFTFTVTARDAAGNSAQAQFAFTVNTLLPDTPAITQPADDPHHQSERTVTLRGTGEDGSSIVVEENGQRVADPVTVAAAQWERVLTGVTPGSHTYAVHAENAAGSTAAVTRTVIIDVGPAVNFDATPPPFTNDNTPTFAFSASAPATFRCALDSAVLASCNSPATLDPVADGAHSFTVVATDESGLSGDPATYAFVVDTHAPDPPTLSGPSGPTTATSAEFTFSAEPEASFECRLDAQAGAACTSPQTYAELPEGTHAFAVVAIDKAGNASEPATRSWTVDHTAPEAPVIDAPAQDAWLAAAAFDVTGTAEPGATLTLFEGTDERGSTTTTAAGTWTIALSAVADGTHRYTARATDAAGNASSSPERSVRVDTDPPETTITTAPGPLTNDATPEVAFSSDEPGARFECSLDEGAFAACPAEFGPFGEGAHTVAVRAVDPAGNADLTPEQRAFTVDLTAPAAPVIDALPEQTRVPQVTVRGSAEPLATVRVYDGDALAGSPQASDAGVWELTLTLTEGRHELTAQAVDRAGNASAPTTPVSVTVDTIAPSLTVAVDRVLAAHPRVTITSDAPFACTLDGAPVACSSSFTPAAPDGPHTLAVIATDEAGNTTSQQVEFTLDSVAPTVSYSDGPPPDTSDSTPTFVFAASESGVTFSCLVDSEPAVDCDSPLTLPEFPDGPHRLQVIATDAAGNSGPPASRSFTVDTKAPTLDLTGPSGPTADNTPTFTLTPESGATVTCTLNGTALPCTSGLPLGQLADNTYTFRAVATDRAGNQTPQQLIFRVDTRTPVARITGGPSGTVDAKTIVFAFMADETEVTFQCTLTPSNGKPVTEPCDGLYIKDLKNGPYTFAVVATDAVGHASEPAQQAFVVAHDGPQARITLGPSGPTNDPAPLFAFDGPADVERYECAIRRGSTRVQGPVECHPQTGYRPEPLAEGPYTFEIQAFTEDEDFGPFVTRTFLVDVTAPVASIDSVPTSPTREPRFTLSSNEPGTLRCRLDDGAYGPCRSPYVPQVGDGAHTLTVVAVDQAGNPSAPVSSVFTVDTTPPAAADVTPSVQGNAASFTFTSGALCRLDGPAGEGAFAACSSPQSYAGLAPGAYRFTVRTTDDAGNSTDATREFSVVAVAAATPTPTPTPSPRPVATPSPTASYRRSVVIRPASGKILVKPPGASAFAALERSTALPLGTTVDAKRGRIQLTSEPARGLPPQKAIFYGGIFVITQPGTMIDLKLVEPLASCTSKKPTKLPKFRRAWGEGKGAFRITGKYSSATVRGTTWLVQDDCSGTRTRVKVGVIAVRNNVTKKTVLVRAGKSYLAKPRR
jgi:hypothetical protein